MRACLPVGILCHIHCSYCLHSLPSTHRWPLLLYMFHVLHTQYFCLRL